MNSETTQSLKELMLEYERRIILTALAQTRGNQRQAAATLGLLPSTLHEKLKRLGLLPRHAVELGDQG